MPEIAESSLRELDRVLDQHAETLIEPLRRPIAVVYVDLEYLFDVRLGALLLSIKGEKDYNYVMEHLEDYENSSSIRVTESFPDLKMTEEQLDLLIDDPLLGWQVVATAPRTETFDKFWNVLAAIETNNKAKSARVPVEVIINIGKYQVPRSMLVWLMGKITSMDSNAKVTYVNYRSWSVVPSNVFERIDLMLVYNLKDMCELGSVAQEHMKQGDVACMKKIVLAYKQHDKKIKPEDVETSLTNFEAIMNSMFLRFSYLERKIMRR